MIDKKIFFRRLKFIFWILIYYSIIVYYGHTIEEEFDAVRGYHKTDFNFLYYFFNLFPLFLYSFLFPLYMKYVSDYIVFFLILIINIPLGYFCLLKTNDYLLTIGIVCLNFLWFLLWISTRHIFIKFPKIKSKISFKKIAFTVIILAITVFVINNGISFQLHNKSSIYKIRELFKAKDIDFVLRYLFTLMQYSLIPLIIMIAIRIESKLLKILYIGIAMLIALSIFSTTALKSSLFVVVIVLIGYLISRFRLYNPVTLVLLINITMVFLILTYEYNGVLKELYLHTIRRVFYVPLKTGILAYEYFILHCEQCGYFSGTGSNVGHTLSVFYFGTDGNSTTGFLANSMLRKGVIKTFLDIGLLIITLKTIDSITKSVHLKYGLVVFIVYGYVLSNTALSTALFSYGLILSLLMVKLLNKWLQKR